MEGTGELTVNCTREPYADLVSDVRINIWELTLPTLAFGTVRNSIFERAEVPKLQVYDGGLDIEEGQLGDLKGLP